jgi:hypothetical protein
MLSMQAHNGFIKVHMSVCVCACSGRGIRLGTRGLITRVDRVSVWGGNTNDKLVEVLARQDTNQCIQTSLIICSSRHLTCTWFKPSKLITTD